MIKPESQQNCEKRKTTSKNFTAIRAIQCGINDNKFVLIAASRSTKKHRTSFKKYLRIQDAEIIRNKETTEP